MLKRFLYLGVIYLPMVFSTAWANEIYITQVGDGLDIDITQDGTGNEFGDSTTDVILTGADMTFSITQTGNTNTIDAKINGADYSGTWDFFGDSNAVTLNCDSLGTAGAGNCEDVQLDIDGDGDDNTYTFNIGKNADAGGSVITFDIDGDNNINNVTVDGVDSTISVVSDNSASLATTSAAGNEGNAITINSSGGASLDGHTIMLTITGGGSTYDITQSGVDGSTIDATFSGDSQDVDITQSD